MDNNTYYQLPGKAKKSNRKKFIPLLILIPFIGVAFISFGGDEKQGEMQEHKPVVILPDHLPLNNGLFWARKQGDTLTITTYNSREYQIEMDGDSLNLFDGDEFVGKVILKGTALDSLITKDNE